MKFVSGNDGIASPMGKIAEAACEAVTTKIIERYARFANAQESQIEKVFSSAICAYYDYMYLSSEEILKIWPQEQFDGRCEELEKSVLDNYLEYPVFACNQYQLDGMRTDFCFAHRNWRTGRVFRLIVECDGHDFHERTKEQAAKDRSRDRSLQEKGYNVFRFTGSELWRDPMKCAEQVADWLSRKGSEAP